MKDWIISIRPKHWIKSGFCIAALVFSGQAANINLWLLLLPVIVGFCMLSSASYLINDVINIEEDSCHPRKCFRPLAAGRLKKQSAIIVGVSLALLGFSLMYSAYGSEDGLVRLTPFVGVSYFLVTILYSVYIRNWAFFDVLVLGLGFIFRVVAGAYALNLAPTLWLLSCTYLMVLLIGFGKRQGELNVIASIHEELGDTRKALKGYRSSVLKKLTYICALLAGGLYIAYCVWRPDRVPFILTAIPVLTGLLAYLKLVNKSQQVESPENLLFKEPVLLGSVMAWILLVILLPIITHG